MEHSQLVRLNISGTKYQVPRFQLAAFPNTRLGKIATLPFNEAAKLCDYYLADSQEFYFARPADMFVYIASRYNTGKLHAPESPTCCPMRFMEELDYWELDPACLAKCCRDRFPIPIVDRDPSSSITAASTKEGVRQHPSLLTFRAKLWHILEKPTRSRQGKAFAVVSLAFLTISTFLIILTSYERFQLPHREPMYHLPDNATDADIHDRLENLEHWKRQKIMVAMHTTCSVWFTIEFLLRTFAAPNRLAALRHPLSMLDILTFLPFWIFWFIARFRVIRSLEAIQQIALALRMLRMFQIIRYMKNVKSYQLMVEAFMLAKNDLLFLASVIFMLVTVFATVMYFIENTYPGSPFTNIPVAMYWCFITITTVGYGDVTPKGAAGQAFACGMTMLGIVVVALPVSIIVTKFSKIYGNKTQKEVLHSVRKLHRKLTIQDDLGCCVNDQVPLSELTKYQRKFCLNPQVNT